MTNDLKASITGVITGLLAILASFGVMVPTFLTSGETVGMIAGIGVMILGILTNKADKK